MMTRSPDSHRLVSLPALVLMTAVIAIVLYVLTPSEEGAPAGLDRPDPVTVAYLQGMLRSHPERTDIRLRLIRMLLQLGHYQRARRLAETLPAGDDGERLIRELLAAEADLGAALGNGDNTRAAAIRQELQTKLRQLDTGGLPAEALRTLLAQGRRLGLGAAFMARLHRALGRQTTGPEATRHWAEAARWSLAAGEPGRAADAHARAADTATTAAAGITQAERAIAAARMADAPRKALALAERFLRRWPDSDRLLAVGIDAALAVNDTATALQWARRLAARNPADPAVLRRLRDVALAAGDLETAADAGRRLARTRQASRSDLLQLARIRQWQDRPLQALAVLQRLARRSGRGEDWEAVARMARQTHDLDAEQEALEALLHRKEDLGLRLRLVDVMLALGRPEAADRLLERTLRHHPRNRELWNRRLDLAEERRDPGAALQLLARMRRHFGDSVELRRREIRLLWFTLDEDAAWHRLQAFEDDGNSSLFDLELHGELAWKHGARRRAAAIYRQLLERLHRSAGNETDTTALSRLAHWRLVLLYEERGETDRAIDTALSGWRHLRQPAFILLALRLAVENERWTRFGPLIEQALRQAELRSRGHELLQMLAEARRRQGRLHEAERLYRRLLALRPDADEARLGLLWLFIETGQHEALRQALRAWQPRALDDEDFARAFAAGWMALGRPETALPWFRRVVARQPDAILWLFEFADALAATGRQADAWRIRRLALARLNRHRWPPGPVHPAGATERAALRTLARRLGDSGLPATADLPQAISDALARERDDRARHWLRRQALSRHRLPAWQQLALALAENDASFIARLLDAGGLSPADRIRAQVRLGRHDQALATALVHAGNPADGPARNAALGQAARARARTPNHATGNLDRERFGELDLQRHGLALRFGGQRGWRLEWTDERLDLPASLYDLRGRDRERRLMLDFDWLGARHRWTAGAGLRRRADRDLLTARLDGRFDLSARHRLGLRLDYNHLSDDSQILRADGALDRLALDWQARLTARTHLSVQWQYRHLKARDGTAIADGQRLDFLLGETLLEGTRYLRLRAQGSLQSYATADTLPADMAARLPTGAGIPTLLSDRYASLGAGITYGRGEPAATPVVGGLRYRLDFWAGWEWPYERPVGALSASIAHRLFGSDALILSYDHSRSFDPALGGDLRQLRLRYAYYFGR